MNIYLAGTDIPMTRSCIPAFRAAAARDRIGHHKVCDDPVEADAVVFTECHLIGDRRLRPILESSLARRFPHKTLVYDERDRPWCSLPGVYVSMPSRHFDPVRQRAWAYYASPEPPAGGGDGGDVAPDLLFSLVASPTHRSRRPLFELRHPRAVVERVDGFVFFQPSSRDFDARRRSFADTMTRSKFVLCPRGRGTSSIRLYETMAAGRAPVVISDEWVPPTGPAWDRFLLRWPEGRVEGLVEMLERHEEEAAARGAAAREAFTEWLAPDAAFHHLASQLELVLPTAGTRAVHHGRDYREVAVAEGLELLRVLGGEARRRLVNSR